VQKCQEILSQVFVGQTRVLEGFRHLVEAGDPSKDDHPSLHRALSFMNKVKVMRTFAPCLSYYYGLVSVAVFT
jgi:hypothetical protein